MPLCRPRFGKAAWLRCSLVARPYSILAPAASERVTVPCQANGEISLDIFHPTAGPPPVSGPATVVLLLSRGPLLSNPEDDTANANYLRSSLPFTVAKVNYRLGTQYPYPTPVHDVLAAYDWVQEHLLPKRSIIRTGRAEHVGRVCIVGELLGGSLATMLALTECRKNEPGVVAAAVNNPSIDWVQPDEDIDLTSPKSSLAQHHAKHPGLGLDDLLRARGTFFPKPEAYFDPFASPILFFRTAGAEIPPDRLRTEADDLDLLSAIEREDFFRQQMLLSGISNEGSVASLQDIAAGRDEEEVQTNASSTSSSSSSSSSSISSTTPRKASRMFPSKSLHLSLPSFHITTGTTSPLGDQADELAQALKKSFVRQYRATSIRRATFGHKVLMDHEEGLMEEDQRLERVAEEAVAEENVRVGRRGVGLGLWDQTGEGRRALEGAVGWLRERLR